MPDPHLTGLARIFHADPVQTAQDLLRVRDKQGGNRPLQANPAQRAFEARRTRHNIVLKARQMGLTTWIAGRFFLKTITTPGTLTVQVAHTREAAEGIFAIAERMWANLPEPLRTGCLRRSRANLGQMIFAELDSEFRVISAAEDNAGRGLTIQNLHLSELARWPLNAAETLAGLRAALAPDGELTIESTPRGAYGAFYEEWQKGELTQHFFPWWLEPGYRNRAPLGEPTEEEHELMRTHGLSRRQISFRRQLERSFNVLRAQEFAEDAQSCFRASGACCFDVDSIERRTRELPAPLESRRGGALRIWLPPVPGRHYILGVDTAGGGSTGDYACVQVIERESGLQCAELRQRLSPLDLAHAAAALATEYNHALLAVERNNHGAAVLAYLSTTEHYANLYSQQGAAGFLTTAASKPAMISRLGALLLEAPELFFSARLLEECRTYVSTEKRQHQRRARHPRRLRHRHSHSPRRPRRKQKTSPRIARIETTERTRSKLYPFLSVSSIRVIRGKGPCSCTLQTEATTMAVLAVQAIRRMRGGAQSQLMLGADGQLWVVKFQNNPQHVRVLANELIATRLAEAIGLSCAKDRRD